MGSRKLLSPTVKKSRKECLLKRQNEIVIKKIVRTFFIVGSIQISKTVHQIKALLATRVDLSSISRSHMVEGDNEPKKVVLWLPHMPFCAIPDTRIIISSSQINIVCDFSLQFNDCILFFKLFLLFVRFCFSYAISSFLFFNQELPMHLPCCLSNSWLLFYSL